VDIINVVTGLHVVYPRNVTKSPRVESTRPLGECHRNLERGRTLLDRLPYKHVEPLRREALTAGSSSISSVEDALSSNCQYRCRTTLGIHTLYLTHLFDVVWYSSTRRRIRLLSESICFLQRPFRQHAPSYSSHLRIDERT